MDVDALGEAEGESWVFKGYDMLDQGHPEAQPVRQQTQNNTPDPAH